MNEPSPPSSQSQLQAPILSYSQSQSQSQSHINSRLHRSDSTSALSNRQNSRNTMPRSLEEYARRPIDLDEYASRAGQVNPEFKKEERGLVQGTTMEGIEQQHERVQGQEQGEEEDAGEMLVDDDSDGGSETAENGTSPATKDLSKAGSGTRLTKVMAEKSTAGHRASHTDSVNEEMANGSGPSKAGRVGGGTAAALSNAGEWRTKRAEEEYGRAYETIVDRDFNMDDYGDPFLEPGAMERFRELCGSK